MITKGKGNRKTDIDTRSLAVMLGIGLTCLFVNKKWIYSESVTSRGHYYWNIKALNRH